MENYLNPTFFFDYESKEIQDIIAPYNSGTNTMDKAQKVYLKIRDGWRYDPYKITLDNKKYKASYIAQKEDGHCLDKAILLVACLRAMHIPARLRLAKVTNHLAVERLTEKFGTNVLTPHGMAEVFLNNKWVKATPAFNKELCELCNVAPLAFNGEEDSMFQEYNSGGKQFMEYLEDYGSFDDFPVEFIMNNLEEHYPNVFQEGITEYRF